ncbi:MAG: oxidoreductase [Actinobacteria bacterium]|nr:oxidoreductase [Actinomycetota bacterium]
MSTFRAFRVHREADTIRGRIERIDLHDLSPGEVVIDAAYSSVNYKDALGATGAGKILTRFPLITGIDVAGTVESSEDPRFRPGDRVLLTGYDFGVGHDGGYAERVRVPGEWVIPVPAGLTLRECMALGSAGLTVALCVKRFEDNGQAPSQGPIVVTGASGGVGSLAVDVLSGLGFEVVVVSGKPGARAYLEKLGAARVLDRHAIDLGSRPLEKAEWAGAIDNVGGDVLAWLTRTTRSLGNICSVGLAGGSTLHTTVMPFILRGVSLLGITSAGCPTALRHLLWRRLGTDLRPRHLDAIAATEIGLEDLPRIFQAMLKGEVTGRIVVRIAGG